jgi:hypothetical protein
MLDCTSQVQPTARPIFRAPLNLMAAAGTHHKAAVPLAARSAVLGCVIAVRDCEIAIAHVPQAAMTVM